MTSEKNYIGQNFDDFLKEENIEIEEDEIMQRIMNIKLMQKREESSEDYKKRVLEYMKESEDENEF